MLTDHEDIVDVASHSTGGDGDIILPGKQRARVRVPPEARGLIIKNVHLTACNLYSCGDRLQQVKMLDEINITIPNGHPRKKSVILIILTVRLVLFPAEKLFIAVMSRNR